MTPQDVFQKSGSVTSVPLGCPNFMQKIRKNNEWSPRYLKMDGRKDGLTHGRTQGQGRLLWTPAGRPGVQK